MSSRDLHSVQQARKLVEQLRRERNLRRGLVSQSANDLLRKFVEARLKLFVDMHPSPRGMRFPVDHHLGNIPPKLLRPVGESVKNLIGFFNQEIEDKKYLQQA